MLAMSAEHLRVIRAERPNERLVWVDVGGGTGKIFILSAVRVPGVLCVPRSSC